MNSGEDTGQGPGKDIPPWLQPVSDEEEASQGTSKRLLGLTILGAVVVISLFVTVILILYDGVSNEKPIHVTAPETPVKEKPADPGGMKIVDRDKTIFDQGDGLKPRGEVSLGDQPETPLTEIPEDSKADPVGDTIAALAEAEVETASTEPKALEPKLSAATPIAPVVAPAPEDAADNQSSKAFRVQLGAYGNKAGAERAWRTVRGQFADQMQGKSADYEDVRSGDRRLYRLRVGPFADRATADQVCLALRAREQACIVVNP